MIQDIQPKKYHCEYQKRDLQGNSRILIFHKNTILLKANTQEDVLLPEYEQLVGHDAFKEEGCQYLFCIDDTDYFLYETSDTYQLAGYEYQNVRNVRDYAVLDVALAVSTGYQLYIWYRDNHFCGRCGTPVIKDDKERMLRCPKCGNMIYPKIAPAVIVGVTSKNRILMTKYADREYTKYALIAGFCEIGETAEDTVRREVMEEVGLQVKDISYYKSQPWGFDSNLLLGYFAKLDGDDQIHMDTEELSTAEWVKREDAQNMDDGVSLTREMIEVFARGDA